MLTNGSTGLRWCGVVVINPRVLVRFVNSSVVILHVFRGRFLLLPIRALIQGCPLRWYVSLPARITPYASGDIQVATQIVAAPKHYLCANTRTQYAALSLSEL